MTELYPLRMLPAFDPRPWGATDLSPIYPDHKFAEKIGEAWLTGDDCKVANGPLAGRTLADLSKQCGQALVGEAARDPERFPLLLKFLFPHEKLSVQVHPDDEQAQRTGQPWGKTECWYVAVAKPGSQVAMGLKAGVTRDDLQRAIVENRAEQLLNWINIYPGEMIYVAGGTVHTLGPGAILVETQQQSDCTYRLYDYGRPRELHLLEGLAAVKERVASGKVVRPAPSPINGIEEQDRASDPGSLFCGGSVRGQGAADFPGRGRVGQEFGADSGGGRGVRNHRSTRHGTGDLGEGRRSRDSCKCGTVQCAAAVGSRISEGICPGQQTTGAGHAPLITDRQFRLQFGI